MNERKQKTILLVDNNSITAADEKKSLEKFGYIVQTAASGKDAIDIFKKADDIDLILMDVAPGGDIDGAAAAEIILKDREVPIVFLSDDTEFEAAKITEKILSYGFASKNGGTGVLDATIKTALKLFDLNSKNKENKEKIEALQRNEERLRFALEKKFVGVWDLDLSDFSAVRSAEYDLIFGYKYPPAKWTYELFLEHVVPEERAAVNRREFRYGRTRF
jgi:CheY-like chemotaxis protein